MYQTVSICLTNYLAYVILEMFLPFFECNRSRFRDYIIVNSVVAKKVLYLL